MEEPTLLAGLVSLGEHVGALAHDGISREGWKEGMRTLRVQSTLTERRARTRSGGSEPPPPLLLYTETESQEGGRQEVYSRGSHAWKYQCGPLRMMKERKKKQKRRERRKKKEDRLAL